MLLLLAMPASRALAQVYDLSGGASTLYEAEGGALTVRGLKYESSVSAGVESGRFVAGGDLVYKSQAGRYALGMQELKLNLPTDILNTGYRLLVLGADVQTTRLGMGVEAFAGGTSTRFDAPLFEGVRPNSPAAALLLHRAITPTLSVTSQVRYASSLTVLAGLGWKATPSLTLGLSSGMGGWSRYNAVSLDLKRALIDLKASYVDAGAGFHRTGSEIDLTPEPVRENLQFTLRSSPYPRFTLSGGRQNAMVAATSLATPLAANATGAVSTSDDLTGFARLGTAGLSGSVLHSSYEGRSNLAFMASASQPVNPRLQLSVNYFESRLLHPPFPQPATSMIVGHALETLNSRWAANQTLTIANGQATAGFGGSFLANFATLSADYETFYIATRPENPFQQSLVLDVHLNLFGRLQVHGSSFVSPTGKLLYTTDAHAVAARGGSAVARTEHASFGAAMLLGRVEDSSSEGVEGAAVEIGGTVMFTNSDGSFFFRERRPEAHLVKVLTDQFLDGGRYWVVSAPLAMSSSMEVHPATVIVVRRIGAAPVKPRRVRVPRDPNDIFGIYIPYRRGMVAPPNLKIGDAIPGFFPPEPDDPEDVSPAKPDDTVYGPYIPYTGLKSRP